MKKILIFFTFAVLALFLVHPVQNGDTWMHLKSGQLMIERMQVLSIDDYSYTIAGKEWLNHQWLSQVIFYFVYKLFGVNGLIFFLAIVIFFAFILLFINTYRRNSWLLSVFLVLLVMLFSLEQFLIRPLIFSLFLFSLFIFILHRYKYVWPPEKEKYLYALIPLQIFWVNLHGAAIMGIFLVWAYIAGEFIDNNIRRNFKNYFYIRKSKYKKLLYVGILVVVSAGLTPYGYRAILFPINELKEMYFLTEWAPALHKDIFLNFGAMPYYRLFLLISICVFIFRINLISSANIIIFGSLLYLSLSGKRHLPLYGFAIAPCISEYLRGIELRKVPLYIKKFFIGALSIALALYLVLLVKDIITGRYYVRKKIESWVGLGKVGYPEKAVDFLLKSGLKGNMFNDFSSGCDLIWGLYPEKKVFIDGRNTIYGSKFIEDNYVGPLIDTFLFERVVDKYNITYVFLNDYVSNNIEKIVPYLYHSENWKLIFFDDMACIFVKNTESNFEIINKYHVDLREKKEVIKLNKFKWQIFYPKGYINRAAFYEKAGLLDMAIDTLRDTLLIAPEAEDGYCNLGILYLKKEMWLDAVEEFKKAIKLNKKSLTAHNNLGAVYIKLGRYKDAIDQFKKVLWLNPLYVEAIYNIRIATRGYKNQKLLYKNTGM
ncbi:MAG: tetratricopeptide repeat protein [Candidatus Omnitrophota bacterium]|nr:tetratricopeptide repeat protein [Candidatus Omnitrophota bacterium]